MHNKRSLVAVLAAVVLATASGFAAEMAKSTVLPAAELKWTTMGNAGVATAPVSGDMGKGPCRFFLKYPAGLVTPMHHHSADHHVTVVSGSLTLMVEGKEHHLGPGSYFKLADKVLHAAKVEGKEDAVMFIQADAAWDVVMAK